MCKEIKKRIESLDKDLKLQETKINLVLKDLKDFALKVDSISVNKFRQLLNDLQHFKNEYNCIKTQLNTFTIYQTRY
jgi:hypothetical protein